MFAVQSVGQPQDRGQLNRDLLFLGQQVAQRFVVARGQGSRMKARHHRRPPQLFRIPSQGIAMASDQLERRLVVSLIPLRLPNIVQHGCDLQAGTRFERHSSDSSKPVATSPS